MEVSPKSKMEKVKSGVAHFFGLDDRDDDSNYKWQNRRQLCYGKDMSTTTSSDATDSTAFSCRKKPKKKMEGVATIAWQKARSVVAVTKLKKKELGVYGRSYAPATLDKYRPPNFEKDYKNELFYDEPIPGTRMDAARPMRKLDMDYIRTHLHLMVEENRRTQEKPATSDFFMLSCRTLDVGGIPLDFMEDVPIRPGNSRIHNDVMKNISDEPKAIILRLEKNTCNVLSSDCCKQDTNDNFSKRPYFTYFITFVHTVIMITALALYGVTKVGTDEISEDSWVRKPNMAVESVRRSEFGNIWIGPRQADLIHLGAKYTPCMRKDPNLFEVLTMDRNEERTTGCCIRDDGTGCVQTVRDRCSSVLSTFMKWNDTYFGKGGYKSGAVCGQDPNFCKKPSSKVPFEWDKKDMTNWPICEDTAKPGHVGPVPVTAQDRHMSCDLLGRPCCHGIQGECMITSREHCDFLRGYYHDTAFLCSQVNCLEEVCGMIPFVYADRPDQFGRVFSSFLLHAGLLHLLISILFHMIIMRTVERLIGWVRMMIIYVGCGAVGSLASATLLPYQVEVGPAGSQFGVLAVIFVDIVNNILRLKFSQADEGNLRRREKLKDQLKALKIFLIMDGVFMLILFFLGLFPFMDNWAHLFGFFFGIFLSLMVIPDSHIEEKGFKRSYTLVLGAVMSLVILVFLILAFYVFPITEGGDISYFNCVPMSETFCKNQDVSINRGSTYTSKL